MLKHQPSPITELVVQGIPGRKFIGLPPDPRGEDTVWGKIFNIYCLGRLSSIRVENILIFMSFVRQKSIPRHFLSIFEKYQLTTFWNSKIVNNILTEKLAFLNHYQS